MPQRSRFPPPRSIYESRSSFGCTTGARSAPIFELRAFTDGWSADLGRLTTVAGRWADGTATLDFAAARPFVPAPNTAGLFGTGDITILRAEFIDSGGVAIDTLQHGERATLRIAYTIRNPAVRGPAQAIVGFHRDGVHDVCRVIARDLAFDPARPTGDLQLDMRRLDLTDGRTRSP